MASLVTVITPSLQQGRFLEDNLRSVLGQDYPDLEHWVVDGGSTDETIPLLKAYSSRHPGRLQWVSEKDAGQSDAINKGLRRAAGDIVAWLNADDLYYPGAVHCIADFFSKHPEIDVVYGRGVFLDRDGSFLAEFPHSAPFDAKKLFDGHAFLLQPTVFWRKRIMDSIEPLDTSLHYGMDFDLWCRMARAGCRFFYDDRHFVAAARYYPETKTLSGSWNRFRELRRIARRHSGRALPAITLFSFLDALMSAGPAAIRKPLGSLYRLNKRWSSGVAANYGEVTQPFVRGRSSIRFPCYRDRTGLTLEVEIHPQDRAMAAEARLSLSPNLEVPLSPGLNRLNVPWVNPDHEIVLELSLAPETVRYRVGRVSLRA